MTETTMRRMVRLLVASIAVSSGLVLAASAAAPVTPSYQGIERSVQAIKKLWDGPAATAQPNRAGWDAICDAVLSDLREYGKAASETDQLPALEHMYQLSESLSTTTWAPAVNLREEIRQWIAPRF